MCGLPALAHHGPEEVITRLSQRIEAGEKSAKIFYQRALEFRILGKSREATEDLLVSLKLDPALTATRHELARVYLAADRPDDALEAAREAVRLSSGEFERAASLMLESEVQLARQDHEAALQACDAAFAAYPGATEVDWFLLRGEIHLRSRKWAQRVASLKQGFDRTQSYVLKTHWIEALIDNGDTTLALREIEPEIESSRWKSSWLLRKARAQITTGDTEEARENLAASLREMDSRMRRRPPNALLMIDHGTAHALLGNLEDASKDLELARQLRAGSWMLQRLESTIAEAATGAGKTPPEAKSTPE